MPKKEAELEYVIETPSSRPIEVKSKSEIQYINPQTNDVDFYKEVMQEQDKMSRIRHLAKKNPFVPLGCLITAGILINGFLAMKRGDRAKSQRMMRYRVAAQGITIVALIGGTMVTQYFVGP